MAAKAIRMALVGALLCQAQVPTTFLQLSAWTAMLRDYSRTHSVGQAMAMTFDGQHPCRVCLKIKSSDQSREKRLAQRLADSKSLALMPYFFSATYSKSAGAIGGSSLSAQSLLSAPDSPPPRILSV